MAEASPTPNQQRDAKDMARELELECLATAHSASADADEVKSTLDMWKFRNGAFYTLLLSYLPVLAYLRMVAGWQFDGVSFWAVAIPFLVAIIACGVTNSDWRDSHRERYARLKKSSVDYWNLANRAKEVRMVKINSANTKGEINSLISEVSQAKNRYSETYQPSTKLLEKSKDHVRDGQINSMDLDKFIRTDDEKVRVNSDPLDDTQEFEEKLSSQAKGG
jgi:hypothetical protein